MSKIIKVLTVFNTGVTTLDIEASAEFLGVYLSPDNDIVLSYLINTEDETSNYLEKRQILCMSIFTTFKQKSENLRFIGIAKNYHIFEILNIPKND